MKTIGLLGGMSWQSTLSYYQLINQATSDRRGGLHSARIAMVSVDFAPIAQMQASEQWPEMGELLASSAQQIESAGADCLLICTNTMHLVADRVSAAISIPLIHIADATAQQLVKDNKSKVALLGTAFTMQKPFYKNRLQDLYDIEVIVPEIEQQEIVHNIIYNELCMGEIKDDSRIAYLRIFDELRDRGAEAVILGCTEIGLLLKPTDTDLPLYDTAQLHALSAVDFALS